MLLARQAYAVEKPVCPERITLAFSNDGIKYHDGVGVDKDFVDELARRSQCRFETSVRPRVRVWKELETGALMMSVAGIWTPERDKFAWFAFHFAQKNMALLRSGAEFLAPDAFLTDKRARWGVVRGYKHSAGEDAFIAKLAGQGRVVDAKDPDELFKMLTKNIIQGAFFGPAVYGVYLSDPKLAAQFQVLDFTPADRPVPHGLILSKMRFSDTEFAKWRVLVDGIVKDGRMRAILVKYFDKATVDVMLKQVDDAAR